ncbi:substrate binding domain-containing protein, partial [Sphingobium sp.]|uniref:substrate binding domain-containing protein n=1 Tax=Sphingobium sp. TaxID=1912891 RepID=UPI002CB8484E
EQLRRLVILSGTYAHDGWWPDVEASYATFTPDIFRGTPIQKQYDSLGNDPAKFDDYVKKVISVDLKPYDWSKEVKNIKAPIFMVIGDADGVRYEHALELFKAKGGGKMGDMHGLPKSRLAAIQEAEDRATARLRTVSGVLRVSVPTSFGRLHIAPHIGKFLALYPDVDLSVDLSDTYVDLLVEPVDLAIRITNAVPGSCEGHHLAANRRILCASPAYIARHGTPRALSELTSHRLIAAAGQAPWRLINGRTRRVIDFKSKVETNSSEMVRELALSGVGIALRSLWDVGHLLASGALRPVLPEWEAPRDLAVYAVHLRGKGRPAPIDALVAFLKTIIDDRQWE